jgi:Zn-dependent peptidase ImmA (M78 family)
MKVPLWVVELASAFWKEAGESRVFPRCLREAIGNAFPLGIRTHAGLSTAVIRDWLQRRRIDFPLESSNRLLRGCLVVRDGGGVIFLDASDAAAEQHFSLAHELAHFLRHYWQLRQRACTQLGNQILEVFDGCRPPRKEERLHAVLMGIPLGFHAHLMGRDDRRSCPSAAIGIAEEEADRLAYELLAPAEAVAARMGKADVTARAVAAILQNDFGLPTGAANDYAAILLPAPPADPLLQWLKWKF